MPRLTPPETSSREHRVIADGGFFVANVYRRSLLEKTLATGIVAVAAGAGLLRPARILAAEWPKDAFASESVEDALINLLGTAQASGSGAIKIKAPFQAENGAVVPISVTSDLPDVRSITIMVEKNTPPLAANLKLSGTAQGYFQVHVKMDRTSNVRVVVKAGGKIYSARHKIKVIVGGG